MEPSEAQKKAIEYLDSPCIISAGAGSGKTFSLTNKFSYLVKKGFDPQKILCITFTNKAANELKERVSKLVNIDYYNFRWVRTIHSACLQMLKQFLYKIDYQENVTIYSSSEQKKVIRNVLKAYNINPKEFTMMFAKIISQAKDEIDPIKFINKIDFKKEYEELDKLKIEFNNEMFVDIFKQYNKILHNNNAFDFDDILWYTGDLLINDSEFKNYYKNYFQYILVDEFQDVNNIQYLIINSLSRDGNLTVVGDDFQSIFGWRGAKPSFFINFKDEIENAKLFKLEQNYRSIINIVEMSNDIIKKNVYQIPKTCYSEIKSDKKPRIVKFSNDAEEASIIASACYEYIRDYNYNYNDVAILYRAKFNSRSIEQSLTDLSIPYSIIGAVAFFERREIKDLMSYLLFSLNPRDVESFSRSIATPRRGIGDSIIQKIYNSNGDDIIYRIVNCVKNNLVNNRIATILDSYVTLVYNLHKLQPFEALEKVIQAINYDKTLKAISIDDEDYIDRKENVQELINFSRKFNSVADFIEESSLITSNDDDDKKEKVKLMTVHASKGLEFKIVFVIGLEDGLFPHWKALKLDKDSIIKLNLEEERRLFYVATTRAAEILNISYVKERSCSFSNRESRFVSEIKKHCDFINLTEEEI